jgi:hypothetical protein
MVQRRVFQQHSGIDATLEIPPLSFDFELEALSLIFGHEENGDSVAQWRRSQKASLRIDSPDIY